MTRVRIQEPCGNGGAVELSGAGALKRVTREGGGCSVRREASFLASGGRATRCTDGWIGPTRWLLTLSPMGR